MPRRLSVMLFGLVLCTQLHAQLTTGTISGVVKDASGAVIPDVAVTVRNLDTGITRTVTSDAGGRYHAPNLALGRYETQAQVAGFRSEVRGGITLAVGQEVNVDFTLSIGEVAETVTITAEAPLVETTNAALSGLVDDKAIRDLPLNGRSMGDLILLEPGALEARRGTAAGDYSGGGQKISIGGARPQQTSFLLDGADVNDWRNTIPGSSAGVFLGIDTIREFRVVVNAYTAEYGRSGGGVITAVSRSGTNQLHGSVFEFLRNSAVDARNFFDAGSVAPFKRNQFGFTLGGPIRKDKTFFFGSYESLRNRLGVSIIDTVPNALARQGIVPVKGQLTNVGIAPGVKPWLDVYPLPNGRDFGDGTGESIIGTSQPTDETYFMTRVDHSFSPNLSVFSRYTFDDANKNVPDKYPFQRDLNTSRGQYLTLEGDSILSSSLLNAFRFAFNRNHVTEGLQFGDALPAALTFVPGTPFNHGGSLQIAGFITLGEQREPRWFAYNVFQWGDDLNKTHGRHTLKGGFVFERIRFNIEEQNSDAGLYNFTGGLISFLEGSPSQYLGPFQGNRLRYWRQNLVGFYGQDEFQVSPRLTLNLGLREEFLTSPNELNGRAANLPDVTMNSPVVGNPLFKTFKFNLAPRVGFAWNSLGNAKLVVRGGFGMFYDQPFGTYWRSSGYGVPPFIQIAEIDATPQSAVPFPNAAATVSAANVLSGSKIGDLRPFKHTGTGYTEQYNMTIQSQVTPTLALTVGYAGDQGRKLTRTGQMNTRIPVMVNGRKFFAPNAPLINPNWATVRLEVNDANSNYNALILKVDKRFAGGFQAGLSYSFAKIMSDADAVYGADLVSGGENQVMDPYDPRLDRARASFSEKHVLIVNYSYMLPWNRSGAKGRVVNGWQIAGVTRLSSGAPFPAESQCCSNNGSTGSTIADRPDLGPGKNNNPILGGPDLYFDPAVFALPTAGFYGNLGRNTMVGPGLVDFDFSLHKNTAITERVGLQFRAELFNIFNHPNFGTPANLIFNSRGVRQPTAGRITTTSNTSRQIQFALKLTF